MIVLRSIRVSEGVKEQRSARLASYIMTLTNRRCVCCLLNVTKKKNRPKYIFKKRQKGFPVFRLWPFVSLESLADLENVTFLYVLAEIQTDADLHRHWRHTV